MASDHEEQQIKPRRKRWGVAPSNVEPAHSAGGALSAAAPPLLLPSNDGGAAVPNKTSSMSTQPTPSSSSSSPPLGDAKAKALAKHESIRARLAAFKAKQAGAADAAATATATATATASTTGTLGGGGANSFLLSPSQQPAIASPVEAVVGSKRGLHAAGADEAAGRDGQNQAKRARHYDVDFSVVPGPPRTAPAASTGPSTATSRPRQHRSNSAAAAATAAATAAPTKKKVNPYLAHVHEAKAKAADQLALSKTRASKWDPSSAAVDGVTEEARAQPPDAADDDDDEGYDPLLALASRADAARRRRGRKEIRFVEPGKWQEVAQKKREIAAKAEAAGYVSGRKAGHTITSSTMAAVYGSASLTEPGGGVGLMPDEGDDVAVPRADAAPDADGMPLVCEWWDLALLPAKLRKEVAAMEDKLVAHQAKEALLHLEGPDGNAATTFEFDSSNGTDDRESLRSRCYQEASLGHCKTSSLVQHIVPIQPPKSAAAERQPVLHLTKKELKRQRKLRRQARQRELQDMQAAGLIPAPEPRLTLQNFIQVMGDQAYLDPSKIEQKIQKQVEARQRAHMERNEASRLTKEQRAAKRARKYHEDTSAGVVVAVYYVLDTSHPFLRAKIDLNAQQNNVTGGVLECEVPRLSCVICEGGPKAIKRYRRLMEVRMKWTGPEGGEVPSGADDTNDGDEAAAPKFNPDNRCELVWQGMAVKRHFKGFVFQACETADQARAVLKSKGVAHYWDQVLEHHKAGRSLTSLQLRLAAGSTSESEPDEDEDEDIVMKESDEP